MLPGICVVTFMSKLNFTVDMTHKLYKQTHRKGNDDTQLKFLFSCEDKIQLTVFLGYLVLAVNLPWRGVRERGE